jgi:outer membrane putative beta-barrel porin/alpha-amylase
MSVSPAIRIPLAVALFLLGARSARAQQRPLTTEDPEVIGAGRMLVEAGIESGQNARYFLSGLTGDRVALPVGVSIGLGNIAEVQFDAGYTWFGIDSRTDAPLAYRVPADATRTSDVIDLTIGTKIRVCGEGTHRPAFGIRFATRLPNASNESGLGLDTTDFSFGILGAKTFGPWRITGNAGLGILSSPLVGTIQDDAFVGGVSLARALTKQWDVVGEVTTQKVWFADVPPIGAEPLGEVRLAARYRRGRARFDAGVLAGFTQRSPDFGLIAGVTIVGQAFTAP